MASKGLTDCLSTNPSDVECHLHGEVLITVVDGEYICCMFIYHVCTSVPTCDHAWHAYVPKLYQRRTPWLAGLTDVAFVAATCEGFWPDAAARKASDWPGGIRKRRSSAAKSN